MMTDALLVKVARRYLRPQGVSTQDWAQQKAALKETVPDAESLVISFSDDDSDEDATKTRREANQFSRRLESTLRQGHGRVCSEEANVLDSEGPIGLGLETRRVSRWVRS